VRPPPTALARRVLYVFDGARDIDLVRRELEPEGIQFVAKRTESEGAFRLAVNDAAPDVVIAELSDERFDVTRAVGVLRDVRPIAPLILLIDATDDRAIIELARAGVEDLVRRTNLQRLVTAIESAVATRRKLKTLSPRQLEVLRFVSEGRSTRDIAAHFGLSVKTVECHRSAVMKRLGFHDIASLVRYAVRVALVPNSARAE
jgi:DNA-binding NarL/FixJ family response regulator